jgi:hypothetical protein
MFGGGGMRTRAGGGGMREAEGWRRGDRAIRLLCARVASNTGNIRDSVINKENQAQEAVREVGADMKMSNGTTTETKQRKK